MKLLIVDDESEALVSLKRLLRRAGYSDVDTTEQGKTAVELIRKNEYDVVLLDLIMPDLHGMEILEATKPYKPETEFIILTAVDEMQTAVKAVRSGAYDYLVKPTEPDRILLAIERAFERKGLKRSLKLSQNLDDDLGISHNFSEIVTNSRRMKEVLSYTEIMAKSGNPILITGESGTGKELLAKAIHKISNFSKGPFLPVNVASVPESLFESQFFGHTSGAFTGAREFEGYFKLANNGSLFLDEIGELPLNQQVKFLRVLEDKLVTSLGESTPKPVNLRIISATNTDIDEACRNGKFRLDLLYRLKSAHVHLPPLRDREGDIELLTKHFISKFSKAHGKSISSVHPEVFSLLSKRAFKGNVRELAQLLENAVLLSSDDQLTPKDIGEEFFPSIREDDTLLSIKENTSAHVNRVLNFTNGDKKKAAEILGISVRQVQRLVVAQKDSEA
ncbi:MAG: sigma-54 dependent transcriptional regulator [Bacteroidetes bacterium]|nr:sigma-54 dependent transcriptional regulator [Bacteroidota bacterium]